MISPVMATQNVLNALFIIAVENTGKEPPRCWPEVLRGQLELLALNGNLSPTAATTL